MNKATRRQFPQTDLYGITASEHSLGRSNEEVVAAMLEAGIKIIQYREKDFPTRRKYQDCLVIRDLCTRYGACFIVNDDVHLAMAANADGVHVGQDDLPPEEVRRIVGPEMIIGLSTHTPEQAQAAAELDIDYIGVGPIFETFTKKDVCAPVGLEYLDYVVSNIDLPHVAIGGIKLRNIVEVMGSGARCVALVTEIVGAPDIGAITRDLRTEMSKA